MIEGTGPSLLTSSHGLGPKQSERAPPSLEHLQSALEWIRAHAPTIAMLLVLVATARIVSTYWVFNHTFDEPAHIACGLEWLAKGTYNLEPVHPPITRVMVALGPFLDGARPHGKELWQEGLADLYVGHRYEHRLALARAGVLPFFWIACLVVYLWGVEATERLGGVLATLLFTNEPTVLAHAGLATTDMGLTAALGALLLVTLNWLRDPNWRTTVLLGVCGAFAALTKFSSLIFFPACGGTALVVWLIIHPRQPRVSSYLTKLSLPTLASFLIALVLVWACYRFSFDGIPTPEFFTGIQQVWKHNAGGHSSYLLGTFSHTGFWYYYPVALLYKTPVAFLILAALGVAWCRKGPLWIPIAFAAGLGVAVFSRIDIGTRYILPIFLLGSLIGAGAALRMLESNRKWMHGLCGVLLGWLILSSALSHPDYLAYFNFLAGDKPEEVLVDSDLDWGQDMKRLSARLKQVGARQVAFNQFIHADLELEHGFPPIVEGDPRNPAPGWNAVSLTELKLRRGPYRAFLRDFRNLQPWPERFVPEERVGKGILLYYFPPTLGE